MSLPMNQVRSFFEMLSLAVANNRFPGKFSNELLIAIYWEQSLFQNLEQAGKAGTGPRVGFGLLEQGAMRPANFLHTGEFPNDTHPYTKDVVVRDDNMAAALTPDCLEGIARIHEHESIRASLDVYAGVTFKYLPPRWLACEAELKSVLQGFIFDPLKWDPMKIERALRKARAFPTQGPVYNRLHAKLFPFVDILSLLLGQSQPFVAQGSSGRAVWAIQELLNQASFRQRGRSELPRLDVDGWFGPKTYARVREFQGRNSISPDGVVGPQTKTALAKIA